LFVETGSFVVGGLVEGGDAVAHLIDEVVVEPLATNAPLEGEKAPLPWRVSNERRSDAPFVPVDADLERGDAPL
jgi:hypothetical protein